MTRTSDLTQRHTVLTAFAAAALMATVGIAQAQGTTQPPDARGSNVQNTQGLGQESDRPAATRSGSDTGTMGQRSGSTSGSAATTTQTAPSASDTNREASQGQTADRSRTGAAGTGGTAGGMSSGSMSSSGTMGSGSATTTQTTPSAADTNRRASQGMTADRDASMGRSGSTTMGRSDLRNDRDVMARAPRADRN